MPSSKVTVPKGSNLGKRKRERTTDERLPPSSTPDSQPAPESASETSSFQANSPRDDTLNTATPPPSKAIALDAPPGDEKDDPAKQSRYQKQKQKRTRTTTPKPRTKPKPESQTKPTLPWPEYLTHLEKTHRALNLVSTFFSARRGTLAPTFDTLKPAVEGHIKCELLAEDVAAIVALRRHHWPGGETSPKNGDGDDDGGSNGDGGQGGGSAGVDGDRNAGQRTANVNEGSGGVRFEYVTEVELALSMGGAESDRRREYVIPDGDDAGSGQKQVLVFEFLDGELRSDAKGSKARDREDRMKMPVFSQAQMMRLIERRNAKFMLAANEFVERCVAEGLDPEMVLKDMRERYIPRMTEAENEEPRLTSTLPATIPRERKSIPEIVQEIKDSPWYTGQIVPDGHRVFEAQEAVYGDLDFLMSQDLVNALYNAKGITQFYAHQAEAINALHEGYNVVVATSTSSGKSLIYQLPVLHALEQDPNTRAMYIFPTKALAQDQRRSLKEMMGFMPGMEEVMVETFDGDTPMNERNTIRDEARIIFTNPDMLHITILPQEDKWRTFLKNLKYVVGRFPWPGGS
jgi:DEAD/DEAH box helicase domain-containing protein